MWPTWFTNVSFTDVVTYGRAGLREQIEQVARETPGLSRAWAEMAGLRANTGRLPNVNGAAPALEIAQLCLVINRAGLILVAAVADASPQEGNMVHALEWVARHADIAVVALFTKLPENVPPFDRIAYSACRVTSEIVLEPTAPVPDGGQWLTPVVGRPHPLSMTEQRLASALRLDKELGPLFGFNQFVETSRGTRPKVDLLWRDGRVVVELDGFADHGTRSAFMQDRNRDYELTSSGYVVLRLVNEEVAQDLAKAIEKIRDVVRIRST